jgi:hypothetical protein
VQTVYASPLPLPAYAQTHKLTSMNLPIPPRDSTAPTHSLLKPMKKRKRTLDHATTAPKRSHPGRLPVELTDLIIAEAHGDYDVLLTLGAVCWQWRTSTRCFTQEARTALNTLHLLHRKREEVLSQAEQLVTAVDRCDRAYAQLEVVESGAEEETVRQAVSELSLMAEGVLMKQTSSATRRDRPRTRAGSARVRSHGA